MNISLKINIFAIILLSFSCNNSNKDFKSDEKDTVVIEDLVNAKIRFDKTDFDFGELNEGEVVECSFIYTNIGTKDLEILNTSTDCGCTIINIEQKVVKSGQKGNIKVKFDSNGLFNNQLKEIKIKTNAINSEMTLIIGAFVKSDRIRQ